MARQHLGQFGRCFASKTALKKPDFAPKIETEGRGNSLEQARMPSHGVDMSPLSRSPLLSPRDHRISTKPVFKERKKIKRIYFFSKGEKF